MLIPLKTDRQLRIRPRMTSALVIINMLVYLVVLAAGTFGGSPEQIIDLGVLTSGDGFRPFALITYQFLHDPSSIFHLLFNMVFLWVFGSAVEDRMGHRLFLLFYLVGGICAGCAHMLVQPGVGVIGASGATAAVTGAFLALYPRGRVLVLIFFILIGIHAIRAPWLVAIYFGIDLISQLSEFAGGSKRNVAYAAHLAGYAFGIVAPLLLLWMRVLPRDPEDGVALLRQWHRRREFRRLAERGGTRMWDAGVPRPDAPAKEQAAAEKKAARKNAAAAAQKNPNAPGFTPGTDPQSDEAREALRRQVSAVQDRIAALLAAGDHAGACESFVAIRAAAPEFLLSAPLQHEIAGALFAAGHHEAARQACDDFLRGYRGDAQADEIRLMLAVLHGRRLGDPARGGALARDVAERRSGDDLGALAAQLDREFSPT